jgi:hypothetical protein
MFPIPAPVRRVAAAVAAVVLVSCGGATPIEPFDPARVIAFGDELSAFTSDGRKYAVNGFATDGTPDCKTLPLWIQKVTEIYGYGFAECPVGEGEQKGISRAAPGAGAAQLVGQIDAEVASGGFDDPVLALVLVGMNDVLELYARYPAVGADELKKLANQRGVVIGDQINRLTDLGAKVIVATTIDMGLTPYARAQDLQFPASGRSQLLTDLSAELNGGIRTTFVNDGRLVGLVLGDEYVQAATKGAYGLKNVKDPACLATAPLPDCNSLTLVTGAAPQTWLWADTYRPASDFHLQIGSQAASRARNNPF